MRRTLYLMLVVVAAGLMTLTITGCEVVATGPEPPQARVYYYYPDCEVYYEPALGFYFWYDHGEWHRDRDLPHRFVLEPGRRVEIHLDTDRPYLMHQRIRAEFPGHEEHEEHEHHERREDHHDRDWH